MTPEEEIEMLKEALENAHELIQEGMRVLERLNRFLNLSGDSTDWIEDAKKLLKDGWEIL